MADPSDTSENLSIRCPKCRQRFSMGSSLEGRMVECGACDARFRIDGDVIIRPRKFYPGERVGADLNRFRRVPISVAPPEGLEPMRYAEFNHPEQLEPASPQRILAGVFGVGLMLFIGLMLIFATSPGGVFGIMPLQNKLVVAGFSSLLGLALLVYANPRARGKAAAFGILLGAGVISLPFVFTGQPLSGKGLAGSKPGEVETESPPEVMDPLAVLREKYGTKPLEAERAKLGEAGGDTNAYGVFLTNLLPPNKYAARDYLIRDTEASPSSYPYPRDDGNYLMVLSGVAMDIGKVAEIAGRLGKVERIEEGIGLVVVRVENTQFLAGPAEKLNNKDDPAFYELNQHELRSIDLDRVELAVARMAEAEPVVYRQEISQTLIGLLGKPGITFHDSIAKALIVWAEEPDAAAAAGLAVLRDYATMGDAAPENLVELVTRGDSDDAIPTLNLLWKQNPDRLEKHYGRFGERVIPGLIAELAAGNKQLRRSAIRLLGEVGTEAVAVELEKLSGDEDPEIRVLAERAIAKIRER